MRQGSGPTRKQLSSKSGIGPQVLTGTSAPNPHGPNVNEIQPHRYTSPGNWFWPVQLAPWYIDSSRNIKGKCKLRIKERHPFWTLQCSPPHLKHSLEARRILKLWPSHSLSRWRVLRWRKAYTSQKEGVIFPQQQGCRKAELLQTHCKGRLECPPLPMCARQGTIASS